MTTVREIIAGQLFDPDSHGPEPLLAEADRILAALAAAGYAVGPKAMLLTAADLLRPKWPTMAEAIRHFDKARVP